MNEPLTKWDWEEILCDRYGVIHGRNEEEYIDECEDCFEPED